MSKYLKEQKGGALVLVLIVMLVLTILGATALRGSVTENRFAAIQENRHKAYYLARSGAQSVAEYMIKDPDNTKPAKDLIGKTSASNNQIGQEDESFTVSVSEIQESNDVLITSVGLVNGVEQTVKIRVKGVPEKEIGGIFDHAIAAVDLIYAGNENANKSVIEGSVASKNSEIPEYIANKATEGGEKDPTLVFPGIIFPENFTHDWESLTLENNEIVEVITTKDSPIYVRTDSIHIKNGKLSVLGDGAVHIYIENGNLTMETQAEIYADPNAKIYIYITPPETGSKTNLFQGAGNFNSMFLYAPESDVEWNNSKAGAVTGSIIAKSVKIHNQTQITYDGSLASDANIDKVVVGVSYEGYIWED